MEGGSPEISSCDVRLSSRDINFQYNECRCEERLWKMESRLKWCMLFAVCGTWRDGPFGDLGRGSGSVAIA